MGVQYMVLDQEAVRPEWWSGEEGGAYARLASGGGGGGGLVDVLTSRWCGD